MNHIFRAAGRLAVDVARIKSSFAAGRLDLGLARIKRTANFVTSRSLVNGRACGVRVGNQLELAETGGKKEIDFASIFKRKGTKEETTHDHHDNELSFDSVFTGEVETKYLEYLENLDPDYLLHVHVSDFPRKRSEKEKKLLFDKYVAYYERKFPSDEVKEKRYGYFKEKLDFIDEVNTAGKWGAIISVCMELFGVGKTGASKKKRLPYGPSRPIISTWPYFALDKLITD